MEGAREQRLSADERSPSPGVERQMSDLTLPLIVAVVVAVALLLFGALSTKVGQWYQDLRKPSWNPPNWAFGPAWTFILGLAAWAGVLSWSHATSDAERWRIVGLFAVNIVLHALWSPLFFGLRRPDWALIEVPFLWMSIVALMVCLAPLSVLASALLLPYLLWVSFAAFLNLTIVRLNPRLRQTA
jgi:benzodiazapine receptor